MTFPASFAMTHSIVQLQISCTKEHPSDQTCSHKCTHGVRHLTRQRNKTSNGSTQRLCPKVNVKKLMFVKKLSLSVDPMIFPLGNDWGAIICRKTTVEQHKRCSSELTGRLMPTLEFAIFVVVPAALLAMTQSIFPNFRLMIWHRQYPIADIVAHLIPRATFA